jgi:hypothetical protein
MTLLSRVVQALLSRQPKRPFVFSETLLKSDDRRSVGHTSIDLNLYLGQLHRCGNEQAARGYDQ